MKLKSVEILNDLKDKTIRTIDYAKAFQNLNFEELNNRPAENKWSILECFEHINLYGDIYLKEIEARIINSKFPAKDYHKTGIIGNYSANIMLPKGEEIPMKMNTFKYMNPFQSELSETVLEKFIKQQEHYLLLIEKARNIDLTKTKCGLVIKGLKFRMGDAMRFYTFHNVRHIVQANNIIGKASVF